MKRFCFFLLASAGLARPSAAQSDHYTAIGVVLHAGFTEMPGLGAAIDTINARSTWASDYQRIYKHYGVGLTCLRRNGFYEIGGNLLWGATNDIFSSGDDPNDNAVQEYSWYVRQRTLALNLRLGLCLGNRLSLGVEGGGMLSNFQSVRKKSDFSPVWILNYSGTRSAVATLTPYLSLHYQTDKVYLDLQPYYTLCYGKMSFKNVFDKTLYSPVNDINESTSGRLIGLRLVVGISSED